MRAFRWPAFAWAALALSCSSGSSSGGGDGNPPANPPPALQVLLTDPDDGGLDVAVQQSIVITFNQVIAAATVDSNSVRFTSPLGPVDGTLSVQGAEVTFDPSASLPSAGPIIGTITTDVVAESGGRMSQDYEFTFDTEYLALVIAEGYALEQAKVAVSAGGLVMAMWVRNDAGAYSLFARGWEAATGWGVTTQFPVSGAPIHGLSVQCTETNEAVAVWMEGASAPYDCLTARFEAGQGWLSPVTLSTSAANSTVLFAMHRVGWGGAYYTVSPNVRTFRYLDSSGAWQNEETVAAPGFMTTLTAGANGEIFSTFDASNPATGSAYSGASRYVQGSGWTSTALVPGAASSAFDPVSALVFFGGYGGFAFHRFNGADWEELDPLEVLPDPPIAGIMSVAPGGEACLVWDMNFIEGAQDITAAFRDASGVWMDMAELQVIPGTAGKPAVATADTGQSWVVFSQFDGTVNSIWVARYGPGAGWDATIELDEDDIDSPFNPQVAAQGQGGCAVWFRQFGQMQLMARILK